MKTSIFTIGIFFALTLVPASAAPVNPQPSTLSLAQILQKHVRAVGVPLGAIQTSLTVTSTVEEGLAGSIRTVESGSDYRSDSTRGDLHTARGSLGGVAWRQNANGFVIMASKIHNEDAVNVQARARLDRGNLDGATLLGTVSNPVSAYVVRIDPPGGRKEYLFYDTTSFYLVRTERMVEGQEIDTSYSDFRLTNGQERPWHIRSHDSKRRNISDFHVVSVTTGIAVTPAMLAIPTPAPSHLTLGASSAEIPTSFDSDRIIVHATLAHHAVNFLLDSGSSTVLLNSDVAHAVGLKIVGSMSETAGGRFSAGYATLPKLTLGSVVLRNLIVQTAPFEEVRADGSPIAGLLGFDALANGVVHIDYVKHRVELLDAGVFTPPAHARVLSISDGDEVPMMQADIAGALGTTFIMDTGADRSMLFRAFVRAHSSALMDHGLGRSIQMAWPASESIGGVGGLFSVGERQVSSLGIAGLSLPPWLFLVPVHAPGFEHEDFDGLIGQDVLRFFDVYLDYPHLKVYLVPNSRYLARFGTPSGA